MLFRSDPAGKLALILADTVMVGVEAYGAFGPTEDVERVFGVVDLKGSWWDLNVGIGANRGSSDHPIGKLIFGIHP